MNTFNVSFWIFNADNDINKTISKLLTVCAEWGLFMIMVSHRLFGLTDGGQGRKTIKNTSWHFFNKVFKFEWIYTETEEQFSFQSYFSHSSS